MQIVSFQPFSIGERDREQDINGYQTPENSI